MKKIVTEPNSMDECFYFTNRLTEDSYIRAWVYKPDCPKCKKAKLGKPINPKTGRAKIRSKEYVCPACHAVFQKEDIDSELTVEIKYKCANCGNEGDATTEFKRKKWQGVDAYIFQCSKCNEKIGVTKKMKDPKKKK